MKKAFFVKHLLKVAVLSLFTINCSPDISGTGSGTETVGILIDKNGNTVEDANIVLTDTSNDFQILTTSDVNGKYKFENLPSGVYNLWAALKDTSLAAIRNDILFDSGSTSLGTDTMFAPGAITGYAFAGNKPKKLIQIDIPGTSYHATTDSTGKFVMSPVFPNTYNLHFEYDDNLKGIIYEYDTSNITTTWDDTTNIDTINLLVIPDGPPASPDSLYCTYDTLNETVKLWWTKSKSPDILKYQVFLDDSLNIESKGLPIDTTIEIPLSSYLLDKDSAKVKFYVHSIDSSGNQSTITSNIVEVIAIPKSQVTTTLEWEIFPNPLDTTIIDVPTKLSIKFHNPTRTIDTLRWFDMSNLSIIAITTPNQASGIDTITYSWNKSGQFKIRVEAIDHNDDYCFSTIDTLFVYGNDFFRPENHWETIDEDLNWQRKDHCSAVLGNKIFTMGGVLLNQSAYSFLNKVEKNVLNSDIPSSWIEIDSLHNSTAQSAAVSLNDKIYVIGGRTPNGVISEVQIFDSITGNWTTHDILPIPLCAMSACTLDGSIYITGGITSNNTQSKNIYKLDINTLTCELSGELQNAKAYHQSISTGSGIYTFGGCLFGKQEPTQNVEYFTPGGISNIIGQMPQKRMLFGASLIDNKIYVFGGIDGLSSDLGGGNVLNSVNYYNIDKKQWLPASPMKEGLFSFSIASNNGLIYLIGGSNQLYNGIESKKTYCYYPFKAEGRK